MKFVCFTDVKVLEELNLLSVVKTSLRAANFGLIVVAPEYRSAKFVFDVCRLLTNASSPRARSDPAEEKDSKLKVVADSLGNSIRLSGVSVLSLFLP